ncbi:MAG: triose-phosphate isomerase [Ignavibacteriales bacterium]|nr:triose-phosphate isomerase [Ignavibacteriales bacterium]HOJ18698.1 triose-phosphate isomerase [Ignavibacteriaceae bacterium]HPO56475.1 triose-phosphate isomerase [Ignavibacteriaceae bacterium]
MRKKVIAGNWKMNMDLSESINLISGLKSALKEKKLNCNVVICPPYISLDTARELVKESDIELGAQNMYFEDSGAYTGEISAEMLKSVGCKFVILGHSERRTIFGETDELINKKVHKAILSKLIPIFCFGETLEERESNRTFDVVKKQVVEGLKGVLHSQMESIILAYEPVWAIGTGKTATPDQAEEVHKFVRNLLEEMYNKETADGVVIQYGGSVKPDNAYELLHMPNIDGALVGGACLKAESFVKIIEGC